MISIISCIAPFHYVVLFQHSKKSDYDIFSLLFLLFPLSNSSQP